MSQQIPTIPTLASAGSLPESETVQIRLSLEGDLKAFSDLVRPYRPMFYKKALSIVRNEADAEDVTQTALLKAFTKLSQFRLDSQFRTWVTSIVINEAFMCLRASRRSKQESLDGDERNEGSSPIDVADPRESQSHALERKQLRAAILKAVSLLPSLLRTVFIMRDLRRLSISDTARRLGITNFAFPNTNADSNQFGQIQTTISQPTTIYGAGLGADASPRVIELQAKFVF